MTATARFIALVLGLAAAGSAAAQPAPAPVEMTGRVIWKSKPSANDMANYYPEQAQRRGVGGWALLRCRIATDGRLEACRAPVSFPKDEHFDDMALKLAGKFRMDPVTEDGQPVAGAMITIPITLVTPSGRNNQPVPTPARVAAVLIPGPKGDMPCGLDDQPAAKCSAQGLTWEEAPRAGLFGPIVAAIGPENGLASLQCTAKGGKLVDCRAMGERLTTAGHDAMLALAPHFTVPQRTWNGTKTEGQQVIGIFDWPTLNATYAPIYRDAAK